jgi:hypothetical protein
MIKTRKVYYYASIHEKWTTLKQWFSMICLLPSMELLFYLLMMLQQYSLHSR